jgi:formylmethanofuran dehydrogenase subunit E
MTLQKVKVDPKPLHRPKLGKVAVCPGCGEAYPVRDGESCRACRGESPYL